MRFPVRRRALRRLLVVLLAVWSVFAPPPPSTNAQSAGEVRAIWVDAFHDGIKSPAQIQKLVSDSRRANVNTLLVQVRRRGEAFYLGGPEPVARDQPHGFDALRALLDAAHSGSPRLEVQAWITVYPVWGNRAQAPSDPGHPFNRHGPQAAGEDNWLMLRDDGEVWTGEGYSFDPGHPAVVSYLVDLSADLVRRYDVDGLHLDRVRYHQGDTLGAGVWDRRWGYNPVSVARFNQEAARSGRPDPSDPAWMRFRRDQVTVLVRQIREASLAERPGLKLSAAAVPWGIGPATDADWLKTAAHAYVFQDWRSWLEQGLLDQAFVMNYNREWVPLQATWLDQWLHWQRTHGYGRQVIAGLALYLNDPVDSVRQVRRALAPEPDGSRLAGVAFYSYAAPDPSRNNSDPSDDLPEGRVWSLLTQPVPENDFAPPFAEPAAPPAMPWREQAKR